jgi:hypothetical protein
MVTVQPALPPSPRYALGLPAGSVRALHTLLIVGMVCAMLLIPGRGGQYRAIPPYLVYLLFLAIGNFFAAHGNSIARAGSGYPPPLHMPSGIVRGLVLLGLVATVSYRLVTDPDGLGNQMQATMRGLSDTDFLYLPLTVLVGFFLGVLFRWVIGSERSYWGQDLQAWVSLVSALLLGIAALIHLVVEPTLEPAAGGQTENLHLPLWECFLAGVVAFYFGERS